MLETIREEINKTFIGQRQLEDTLDILGATQEEGNLIIKDYVKKLTK